MLSFPVFIGCLLLSFSTVYSNITWVLSYCIVFPLLASVIDLVVVIYQTALLKRQSRYIHSTVPENAEKEAQSLFVTEVKLEPYVFVPNSNIISDLYFFCFIYCLKKNQKKNTLKKKMSQFISQYFVLKTSSLVLSRENFQEEKHFLLQWLEKDYRIAVNSVACITDFWGWFSSHLPLLFMLLTLPVEYGLCTCIILMEVLNLNESMLLTFFNDKLFNSRYSLFIHSNSVVFWNRGIHSINA